MGWRIVNIKSISKLELKMDKLVVRTIDNSKMIHLSEIDTIIIENTAVSLTASLLAELVKNKINVILCDEKRNPISTVNGLYGSHDSSDKIRNQILWKKEIKDAVWTEIVREKINNQYKFLEELKNDESEKLKIYASKIELGDITNREAHAAKVYFNALFGNHFGRSQDNSINAALNYGYSLILSSFAREIVSNGYITQLGIHHDNMFNHYNLACDLMEPFRILIDKIVYNMRPEEFDTEKKVELINVLNKEVFINEQKRFVNHAIGIYVKSVIDAIEDGDTSLIKNFKEIYEL